MILFIVGGYAWFFANWYIVRAMFPGCEPPLIVLGAIGSSVVTPLVGGMCYGILTVLTDLSLQPSSLTLWWRRRQHARDLRR